MGRTRVGGLQRSSHWAALRGLVRTRCSRKFVTARLVRRFTLATSPYWRHKPQKTAPGCGLMPTASATQAGPLQPLIKSVA
jgi:hypothetical protein